jgi:hypothetical protein
MLPRLSRRNQQSPITPSSQLRYPSSAGHCNSPGRPHSHHPRMRLLSRFPYMAQPVNTACFKGVLVRCKHGSLVDDMATAIILGRIPSILPYTLSRVQTPAFTVPTWLSVCWAQTAPYHVMWVSATPPETVAEERPGHLNHRISGRVFEPPPHRLRPSGFTVRDRQPSPLPIKSGRKAHSSRPCNLLMSRPSHRPPGSAAEELKPDCSRAAIPDLPTCRDLGLAISPIDTRDGPAAVAHHRPAPGRP